MCIRDRAAFLRVKLQHLAAETLKRKEIACAYARGICNPLVSLPIAPSSSLADLDHHVFHLFVVRVKNRPAFQAHLKADGIDSLIHYPIPPHQQQAYAAFSGQSLPLTEAIHREVVSLPMGQTMTKNQVDAVIKSCNTFEE